MFQLLAYSGVNNAGTTDGDLTAATEQNFSQRNGHYTLGEDYNLIGAAFFQSGATRANIQSGTLESISRLNIWPLNISQAVPSPPRIMSLMDSPIPLPKNEEIQMLGSGTVSVQMNGFLWLGDPGWSRNIPRGIGPLPFFVARATATIAGVANVWSAVAALTFEKSLRGGSYALVGANVQGTNLLAFRFNFPKQVLYNNRPLKPGSLATTAIGDQPANWTDYGERSFGEWGRFNTFELPSIEGFANATGNISVEVRMFLVRLSEQQNV